MNNINVISYVRVSKEEMDYSRQIDDIKNFCKRNNYKIVKEFAEKESGLVKQRPELIELMNYCTENKDKINFVIISELSRLGRTAEVLNTIEKLNELKIGLISLKENLQTLNADGSPNPTSALILSVLASINSFEIETLRYRSISGLVRSAKNGNWLGGARLPYGYMRQRDVLGWQGSEEEGKKLVVNPKEAETVRLIFNWYLQGKGTFQIATLLNGKGVPTRTGALWRDKVVYDIIRNPIYVGERKLYKGTDKELTLTAPAIIEKKIFEEANKIRQSNYNKQGINSKYTYLLDGQLIRCGVCGKSYYAHRRANLKDNAYKCISRRYRQNCGNYGINIDKLEYAVKYIFIKEFSKLVTPSFISLKRIEEEAQAYENELDKLRIKRQRLIELYTDGRISKEEYTKKDDEILNKFSKIFDIFTAVKSKLLWSYKLDKKSFEKPENLNNVTKKEIRQVIKEIILTKEDSKQLIDNKQDKVLKAEVISFTGKTVIFYLSQRAEFFIYKNRKIKYKFDEISNN